MTRDVIILGALAGFVGNAVKLTMTFILYLTGLIETTFVHIAGGYFQSESSNSLFAFINSILADFFYASFLGVVFYLILRATEMKYCVIKGVLFGGFVHIIHNGVLVFEEINQSPINDQTNLLLLIPTILFGIVTGWFLEKMHSKAV